MALVAVAEGAEIVGRAGLYLAETALGRSAYARGFQGFVGTAYATEKAVTGAISSLVNSNSRGKKMGRVHTIEESEAAAKKITAAKKRTIRKPTPENTQRRRISTGATPMSSSNTDEVPLIPEPDRLGKIVQDYTTIILPYWEKTLISSSHVNGTNSIDIRLNSIYDPVIGGLSDRQPQGRDAFAQNYQYYRVIRSHVQAQWHYSGARVAGIDFTGPTQSGRPTDATWVIGWETQNGETGALSNTVDAFMVTKHAHREMMYPVPAGLNQYWKSDTNQEISTVVSEGVNVGTVEYQYDPQGFIQDTGHIQNISKSEFWTPVGENPEHRHVLSLRTFGLNNQALIENSMELTLYISYVVQFREYQYNAIKQLDTGDAAYNDPIGSGTTLEGKIDTITGA
jgi:hypothetical protein